jgi:uncharacterized membrane protein/thiol-disulfide isomerase/thioredoxin
MNYRRQSWPWWRRAVTGLSTLGLVLSSYLGWHSLVMGSMIGCGDGNPCDQVLHGRWSSIAGIVPVGGLAAGVYLALLVLSFFLGPTTEVAVRRLAWRVMLVLAGAAAGCAVWFIIVQKWYVRAFCPYCMATHIASLLLAALAIWRASKRSDDNPGTKPVLGRWSKIVFFAMGLTLAGILSVCQVSFPPRTVYRGGEANNIPPAFDPHSVPMIGSPDAPHVVNLLFDYNCSHCQQLHLMLDEAVRRYGGKLAFALCPVPLNTNCNVYVPRNVDEFSNSCDLAKISLAVWVAGRESFPAFDRWMFSFESGDRWQPRTLAAARARAVELVGQAKFDAAVDDPWVSQYLHASIEMYGATVQSGNNAVPRLVFGSRWVIPEPNDPGDFIQILEDSLAVPKP